MLRLVEQALNYTVIATDGEVGDVHDLFFSDADWTVRYVVVNTGPWLAGRKVLISPLAVTKIDHDRQSIHLDLTRERVKGAPDIESDKPVSRQFEVTLNDYYGWPSYWAGPYGWGPYVYPPGVVVPPQPTEAVEARRRSQEELQRSYDHHLRSFKEVNGYHIDATDGELGDVEDMVFDDRSWEIKSVVVDTRKWWFGKNVIVPLTAIDAIDWSDHAVRVNLRRDELKSLPEARWDDLASGHEEVSENLAVVGSRTR